MFSLKQNNWLGHRLFWNVKGWHLLAYLAFFVIFGFIYWLALLISGGGQWVIWDNILIGYSLKFLLSLPIYWLIFVRLKNWDLTDRLLIHFFSMPVFIAVWLWAYQSVCSFFGIEYLTGKETVWNIYIPFLIYSILFGILHFFEYVSRLERQKEIEHELRQLALQSEVNALKAQLQPHFLFNTLNSISASVPPEMERTRELIAQLADTFRFGLRASQSERVPLSEELDFLKTYLRLEKQRFGERLNVEFNVPENLYGQLVPPMLLQPLVENAIAHGVGRSMVPVTVTVGAERVGERLKFSVADTGPGCEDGLGKIFEGNGLGLRNTKLRLEKGFGEKLTVRENEPHGLVFEYHIPVFPVRQSGSSTVRQSDSSAVRQFGSSAVRQFGSPAVRQSGSSTVRQFGSSTVRRFGSPAVRQSARLTSTPFGEYT